MLLKYLMLELLKSYAEDQVSRGQTGLPSGNVLIGQSTPTPVFALDVGHGDWEIKWHIPGYLSHESVTVLGKQMKDWLGGGCWETGTENSYFGWIVFCKIEFYF